MDADRLDPAGLAVDATKPDRFLAGILKWAQGEDSIRAVILEGSRARPAPADDLADYDINVFARSYEPYIAGDGWMSQIAKVWVYLPEKFEGAGEVISTRLVIFEDGVKVDFSFHGTHGLADLAGRYDAPYRVLLDKDGAIQPTGPAGPVQRSAPPTEQAFLDLVNEFWFEAYHVAKYLKRGDLWLVKFRDWTTKELLLRMIELHAQARHGWNYDTEYMGKHMHAWVEPRVWRSLHEAFGRFDAEDSRRALMATVELFRGLALETAGLAGWSYPAQVDRHITGFIGRVR